MLVNDVPEYADLQALLRKIEEAKQVETMPARMPLAVPDAAQPTAQAPVKTSSLSKDAIDATGAGIQGGAKAFEGILRALAHSQALESTKRNDALDRQTATDITSNRIRDNGRDFDSRQRLQGVASLLQLMRQAQDMRAAGNDLQQRATNGATRR